MLVVASPVASTFHRSSKDSSELSKLLRDKVEFVEGSSAGLLAQGESKYPYINVPDDEVRFCPEQSFRGGFSPSY